MDDIRKTMTLGTVLRVVVIVFGLGLIFILVGRTGASWFSLSMYNLLSGSPGGNYHKFGDEFAKVLNESFDSIVKAGRLQKPRRFENKESHGARYNVEKVGNNPELLGFTEEGLNAGSNVRTLIRLSGSPLHVVVPRESKIRTVSDLKDRRVYVGVEGSGTRVISGLVLEHYGLSFSNITEDKSLTSFSKAATALIDHKIDAAFFVAGVGMPAVKDIASKGAFTLLELDRAEGITKAHPFLAVSSIPSASYPSPSSTPFPDRKISTIEVEEVLICHSDLDNRTAYLIVEAIFRASPQLIATLPTLNELSKTDQLKGRVFYPLHPGAVAFFQGSAIPSRIAEWQALWSLLKGNWDIVLTLFGIISVMQPAITYLSRLQKRRHVQAQVAESLRALDRIDAELSEPIARDAQATRREIADIQSRFAKLFAHGEIKADEYGALGNYAQSCAKNLETEGTVQ